MICKRDLSLTALVWSYPTNQPEAMFLASIRDWSVPLGLDARRWKTVPPLTDQPQVTTWLELLLAGRQTNNTRSVLWL